MKVMMVMRIIRVVRVTRVIRGIGVIHRGLTLLDLDVIDKNSVERI